MARKLFLILAISLLIGLLVEQTAADEGVMLSELADDSGGAGDRVYYEADSRMKRGARRDKMRADREKVKAKLEAAKPRIKAGIKKAVKWVANAAVDVAKAAAGAAGAAARG